jgi:hypothetical protein
MNLVSWNRTSMNNSLRLPRHSRESGIQVRFVFSGFRLALARASLAGMTAELLNGFRKHHTTRLFKNTRRASKTDP